MRLVIGKQYPVKVDRETYLRERRKAYRERNVEVEKKRKRDWYLANRELCLKRSLECKRRKRLSRQTRANIPPTSLGGALLSLAGSF